MPDDSVLELIHIYLFLITLSVKSFSFVVLGAF